LEWVSTSLVQPSARRSAALLVWENVWASTVAQAFRDAGGVLVAFEGVPHEVVQAAREWALEEAKV
jgi:hypothetical protein